MGTTELSPELTEKLARLERDNEVCAILEHARMPCVTIDSCGLFGLLKLIHG
jgi:hypothetical protein